MGDAEYNLYFLIEIRKLSDAQNLNLKSKFEFNALSLQSGSKCPSITLKIIKYEYQYENEFQDESE